MLVATLVWAAPPLAARAQNHRLLRTRPSLLVQVAQRGAGQALAEQELAEQELAVRLLAQAEVRLALELVGRRLGARVLERVEPEQPGSAQEERGQVWRGLAERERAWVSPQRAAQAPALAAELLRRTWAVQASVLLSAVLAPR